MNILQSEKPLLQQFPLPNQFPDVLTALISGIQAKFQLFFNKRGPTTNPGYKTFVSKPFAVGQFGNGSELTRSWLSVSGPASLRAISCMLYTYI